jgi:predicted nucleic acid-binding protein
MKVVLDASAGIAGAMGRDAAPWVVDVVNRATAVLAPDLYVAEVTSGFWKYVITGNLTIGEAMDRLVDALRLVERRVPATDLAAEALREASARRHAVYDLYYVVLARREGAVLVTLDTRLRKLVESMGLPVHP